MRDGFMSHACPWRTENDQISQLTADGALRAEPGQVEGTILRVCTLLQLPTMYPRERRRAQARADRHYRRRGSVAAEKRDANESL